jgi:hypothetical protein
LEHTVSRDSKCSILFLIRQSFDANIKAGLGLASLIYGKQEINGTFLTLVRKKFSGLIIQPVIGFQTRYSIMEDGFFGDITIPKFQCDQ